MILGYVDANDRVYDLNFATLKLRMRIEAAGDAAQILFSDPRGAGQIAFRIQDEADVTASVAMDHDGHAVPLLRPVEGRLYRHGGGLLFLAEPRSRDPEDPGFYLVKTRAMLTAVKFFFEDQGGRELISVPTEDVLRTEGTKDRAAVYVTAANVALPREKIAYAVEFAPASRATALLTGLGGAAAP